jgi:hypothetical protein
VTVTQSTIPGTTYRYVAELDNYAPARNVAHGMLTVHPGAFEHSPDEVITFDPDDAGIPDGHRAVYLITRGASCRPFYVAGWSSGDDITPRMVMLHPIDGAPSGWRLGPRRAYHLTLTEA